MNDSSQYVVALYGLKAKDFKNLDELIINGIRNTFIDEYIKEEIVEQYINHSPGIIYTKTKDRSTVARLNKSCDEIYFCGKKFDEATIYQSAVSRMASADLIRDRKVNYTYTNENLYNDLENFANTSIFRCKSVVLKITLNLLNHKVWRRVIVPMNISFKELHDIIQIAFSWSNYHLHEFVVFEGIKPIVKLCCDEAAFEYPEDLPMILDFDVKLSEYIPKCSGIEYRYDFGDGWEHYIEAEKIIEEFGWNYPVCICGEGNTPPEDVGGDYGYDNFLSIISDPNNPDHDAMVNWGKMQRYGDFDVEFVNRRLKSALNSIW